jgi:hypothetical protein
VQRPLLLDGFGGRADALARYGNGCTDVAQEDTVVRIVLANGSCETTDTFFVTTMWIDHYVRKSRLILDRTP